MTLTPIFQGNLRWSNYRRLVSLTLILPFTSMLTTIVAYGISRLPTGTTTDQSQTSTTIQSPRLIKILQPKDKSFLRYEPHRIKSLISVIDQEFHAISMTPIQH